MQRKHIESSILSESVRFIKKDHLKLPLVASLYASSIIAPGSGRLTRATYFFIRHLDDVLDGEMSASYVPSEVLNDPVNYARNLQQQITGELAFDESRIADIGRYALNGLQERANNNEDPGALLAGIIEGMIFDHERRLERKSVPNDVLENYYGLFNDFVDVTLMALGERARTASFPMFGHSQGRLYSVRDIRKDWNLGIINVPSETLNASKLTPADPLELVLQTPGISAWINSEVQEGVNGMKDTLKRIDSLQGASRTRMMIKGLAKGAMKSSAINQRLILSE